MRILKSILLMAVLVVATGCVCNSRDINGQIPGAVDGGPLKDVNFAFDSYTLDESAKATLDSNYMWLSENPKAVVKVEGHCDERGTNEYNMVLGANRAKAAEDYLRAKGLEAGRSTTVSYGEEIPLDPAHNEAAWSKNRRAHFDVRN